MIVVNTASYIVHYDIHNGQNNKLALNLAAAATNFFFINIYTVTFKLLGKQDDSSKNLQFIFLKLLPLEGLQELNLWCQGNIVLFNDQGNYYKKLCYNFGLSVLLMVLSRNLNVGL